MLVHDASLGRDRVVCVVGVAGAGKTTALRALADAYRESGVPVLGAAPSGRAADELQTATGIPSRTLHRLLLDASARAGSRAAACSWSTRPGWPRRACSRRFSPRRAGRGEGAAGRRPGPAPAVGAGGLYPALCERLGAIEPRPRTAASATRSNAKRSPGCARRPRALPRPRRPPRPPRTSTTTRPRPSSGCSPTGGRQPNATAPET